jgi:hypothetical protein
MAPSATVETHAHPAPHRERARLAVLMLAILAPPAAWSLHLAVNFAFASHACYPARTPLQAPLFDWLRILLISVDLASMAVALAAVFVAYGSWRKTAREMAETGPLVELGEGRARFLAAWGILIGIGFFIAVLFDFVGLWIVPICG